MTSRNTAYVCLWTLVAMIGTGVVLAQEQKPPAIPSFPAPGTAPPLPPPANADAPSDGPFGNLNEPEDGKWLVDPEGYQYFVKALPKSMIVYRKMDENTVRLRSGPWFRLAGEDDENLYVKIYRPREQPNRDPDPGPSQEEIDAVEKSYETATKSGDRLRFVPFDEGLPTQGIWRNGFDVADMNGDGQLDIVHGPPRRAGGSPWIFLGNGAGRWRIWEDADFPRMIYDYGDAAAGDWNGDGKMDLALAMHMKGVVAMVGDGKGAFSPWTRGIEYEGPGYRGLPAFTSRTLEVVDWDADGDPDLLVLAEGPRGLQHVDKTGGYGKVLYLNQGDGTWVKKLDEAKVFGDHLALGDYNGDRRLDFATSTNVGNFHELLNLGEEDGSWSPAAIDEMRGGLIWSVASGDFDGNGRTDLATGYYGRPLGTRRAGIDVLLSKEDGSWVRLPVYATKDDVFHCQALGVGDLDGDGHLDLVGGDREGRLVVFLGDGAGGFVQEQEADLEASRPGCQARHIRLIDLDRDGRAELLATLAGESCPTGGAIRVWRTEPAPPFAASEAPEGVSAR